MHQPKYNQLWAKGTLIIRHFTAGSDSFFLIKILFILTLVHLKILITFNRLQHNVRIEWDRHFTPVAHFVSKAQKSHL